MRKINKKYIQIGMIAAIVACIGIAFNHFIASGNNFSTFIGNFKSNMLPVFDGIALAYFLNPLMKYIEKKWITPLFVKLKVKDSPKNPKRIRACSLTVTITIFLLIIAGLILLIVPQLLNSIQSIIIRFPSYVDSFTKWADQFLVKYPQFKHLIDNYWENITEYFTKEILPMIQALVSTISSTVLGSVWSVLVSIFKLIIGIILSVYLLYSKEVYVAQIKKVIYSLLDEEKANNLINNSRFANKTFGGFISGKIVDSIIIGILCFIGTSILRIPYALLVSVVVGVTNVIPFFGPFLGAIPTAFIILMINPVKCLWFLILVLILQQLDGNIIGPKILGDSTGLSSFWVIFAITVFGSFFGVMGMFLGVPIFAIIYAAIRTFINTRLEKKHMPDNTEFYISSDYHSEGKNRDSNTGEKIMFARKTFSNVNYEENNLTNATMELEFEEEYISESDSESEE